MRIGNDTLNLDGTSMAVDITSEPIYLGHIAQYNIQLVFTGTPDGSFKLQVSNDQGRPSAAKEEDRDFKIVNWTDMTSSVQAITEAGNHSYEVADAGHLWVRLVWTASASTGTLTSARFNVKGI